VLDRRIIEALCAGRIDGRGELNASLKSSSCGLRTCPSSGTSLAEAAGEAGEVVLTKEK
jgi:hypothetical protein